MSKINENGDFGYFGDFFGTLMPPTFSPFEGIGKEFADLRQIVAQRVHYILPLLSIPVYCKRLGTRLCIVSIF